MSGFIHISDLSLKIEVFDKDFLILKANDTDTASLYPLANKIYESRLPFVEEVIHTETEILIKLNNHFNYSSIHQLTQLSFKDNIEGKQYRWPVHFDGHEWDRVCEVSGLEKEECIYKLSVKEYQVSMRGFLPGFVYARSLDPSLHIPER